MLPVSFIITMTVAAIVFIAMSRWQTLGSDRQKLADRARTLDVLGSIVDRHANAPVDTSQGIRHRPAETQRRVARPLPAAFTVIGSRGAVTPPPISPRLIGSDGSTSTSGDTSLSPVSQPDADIADIDAEVVHRQMLRLRSVDLPDDPCAPNDHRSSDHIDPAGPDEAMPLPGRAGPTGPDPHFRDIPLPAVGASPAPRSSSPTRPSSPHRQPAPHLQRRRRLATIAAAISIVAAVGFASNWNSGDAARSSAETSEEAMATNEPVTDAGEPVTPTPSIPLAPGMVVGDVAAFEVAAPFTLDLAADQPAWVQVRNRSGQVLLEQTLQPGQSAQVDVDQPVAVRTGNPAGLAVTAGFIPLDHPRPAGQPITLHLG